MSDDVSAERFVLLIVRALVDDPDSVNVTSIPMERGTLFRVTVAPSDAGRVIGKHGQTVEAIKTVLSAMGTIAKTRFTLEIATSQPFIPPADWNE
jgi:predicted RNA-binding protein YlqC (UPF0109 family)